MIVSRTRQFLRRRFPRQFSFVQARLSREGLFGLYLTVGTVIVTGATWLFGGIAQDLIAGDPLILIDDLISEWFRWHPTPRFTTAMQWASGLGSVAAVGSLCALISCFFIWKRLWYWLLGLMLVVPGGMLLNVLLKNLFGRARPGWADPLTTLTDYSFPSGHTMMATITYGFVATCLILNIGAWTWRIFIAAMTVALVFLVALSRMYLGAHYLSDVLAAMAAGTAWLALCLTAVEILRRYRSRIHS